MYSGKKHKTAHCPLMQHCKMVRSSSISIIFNFCFNCFVNKHLCFFIFRIRLIIILDKDSPSVSLWKNCQVYRIPDPLSRPPGTTGTHFNRNWYQFDCITNTELEIENNYIDYWPLGSLINMCQINVEGLTKSKGEYLSRFAKK